MGRDEARRGDCRMLSYLRIYKIVIVAVNAGFLILKFSLNCTTSSSYQYVCLSNVPMTRDHLRQ